AYLETDLLAKDPFVALDQDGVGQLVALAVERGRQVKPDLKVGICGEHGGEPSSIAFCHRIGLDYVSCSPFRVPIARVAAARAAPEGSRGSPPCCHCRGHPPRPARGRTSRPCPGSVSASSPRSPAPPSPRAPPPRPTSSRPTARIATRPTRR